MYSALHIFLFVVVGKAAKVSNKVAESDIASAMSFEDFMGGYSVNYTRGTPEFRMRSERFQASMEAVIAHNRKPNRLWTASINHLSDRTPEEMKAFTNGWEGRAARSTPAASSFIGLRGKVAAGKQNAQGFTSPLAQTADWSHLWTAQKDQIHNQACGNCWAAATATVLEAHSEIKRKYPRHFSVDAITQCTANPGKCGGDGGCAGATSELAYMEVMRNGIDFGEAGTKCFADLPIDDAASRMPETIVANEEGPGEWGSGTRMLKAGDRGMKIGMTGWVRLPENKYEPFMRALVEHGPASVAVDPSWTNYGNGIYGDCPRDATITHAVAAMGFGVDTNLQNTKYWLIQNSWGTGFGENGHIRLKRSDNEAEYCGKDSKPELGTTCASGPKEVSVCGMCGILYDVSFPLFTKAPVR